MKVAGVVLAGGLSTRMGTNKALLSLQGQTLLARSQLLLTELGLSDCWISGDFDGFRCIPDQFATLGPIGGIYSCAQKLQNDCDYLLVLPVDMPYITERELRPLIVLAEQQVSGAYQKNATFPMLIKINEALLEYLYTCLVQTTEKKGRSLYRMVRTLNFIPLAESELASFDNTNTPDEWAECLTRFDQMEKEQS